MASQQPHNPQQPNTNAPAAQFAPRRTDSDLLPQGQERTEQRELMQSYEASAHHTEDDANQAILQREFPNIDGSLIAALYGDSKNMSEVRETLQELGREEK